MVLKRWKPAPYTVASAVIAAGGCLFGLDTGTIGPITTMPYFKNTFGSMSSTMHGLVVSTILIPAAVASFLAGSLADKIGRTHAIIIGAAIFGIGAALEAGSITISMLIVARVVAGIGEGLFFSITAVYVTEIAPSRQRGALVSIIQFLTTLGICFGYFFCYATVHIQSSLSWRLPFIFQASLAILYAVVCFFVPESPRWLMSKGRYQEAMMVWNRLGIPPREREKEKDMQQQTQSQRGRKSFRQRFASYFDVFEKSVRRRTALGVFIRGMQQLSGIDGVLYYAPILFQQAGLSTNAASFLASGVSGLLIMLTTIPASVYSDRWGRRTSTLYGGVGLAACMLLIGSLYASHNVHAAAGAGRWAVLVAIYIFVIIYSATWSIAFQIYSSEIQPPRTRAAASSLAQSANWVVNWTVAFTTPLILARSSHGAYFLFGGSTLFTAFVCALFMPETRNKSLEQIDDAFSGSVSKRTKRSSGMYGPDTLEFQWRSPSNISTRPLPQHLDQIEIVDHSESRVMGPARTLRVMPSVESVRKWLLR